jgi:transcriptional regulator GlxA family with amidase domain
MIRFIQHQAEKGTVIAGVCTGVAMLAEAGLLDGRKATTHWAIADQFRKRYPKYEDVPFFRKIFKRYTGLTPKEYKLRFGGQGMLDAVNASAV